ncbi:MAG: CHAT domain-containing protein [Symploca sp. SIO2E6]|nr:CHAT domain-containing protein [Symploca sp. SIO2E6]
MEKGDLLINDAEGWLNQAKEQFEVGDLEGVIASYDQAIDIKPDEYSIWSNRGLALADIGRYEKVIASYDQAIKIKPDEYLAWSNRGIALHNIPQYQEAIACYDKALELKLDDHNTWINRGLAVANVVKITKTSTSPFISAVTTHPNLAQTLNNPNLNLGGYEGVFATYQEGLKHCPKDTHPEGWGELHQAIGSTQYFRGCRDANPNPYWRKAFRHYDNSLKTLTPEDFPEAHLEVLQDLIRTLLALEEIYQAQEFQRRGTDVLNNLLQNTKSPAKKKQLALKFAPFQQLTVDLAVQSGDAVQALKLAEEGKNACLSWLLASRNQEIPSPTWEEIKQLLNPTTAIVYWHISPAALHTFILKHDNPLPIVLGQTKLTEKTPLIPQIQRLRDFDAWVKDWNQDYSQYRQKKDKSVDKDWLDNLPDMLKRLAKILDIPAIINILQTSQSQPIQNLILIPHRDLHRFPLHALFNQDEKGQNFTISYLPSAQFSLKPTADDEDEPSPQQLLSVEVAESQNLPPLSFVAFEAEAITELFANPQRIQGKEATKKRVEAALENRPLAKISLTPPQPDSLKTLPKGGYKRSNKHQIFHFAGHGNYNFAQPLNSELVLVDEELTLKEIYEKDLASYQLVSLSACETAITDNQTITTEYVGLVSGFLSKGVNQVVSTLWTVKSAATALVMIEFYRRWQAGTSEVQALTEATQWLKNLTAAQLKQWYQTFFDQLPREEGRIRPFLKNELYNIATMEPNSKPYEHPYYWAAFIITGKL